MDFQNTHDSDFRRSERGEHRNLIKTNIEHQQNRAAIMPRKKTPKKTKLSPAEKKDRKRLRDRARQAKKREDPDVRDKENAQQRARQAKKREDSDVRDEENAQKRARRAEDGEYRDALQVRERALLPAER